jgi:Tfp pilus assembly protein PilZ
MRSVAMGDADRRQTKRMEARLEVRFEDLGRPDLGPGHLIENLGQGGVFVATTVGLPLGTTLTLRIRLDAPAAPVRIQARVVHVLEQPSVTGSASVGRVRGLGLAFEPQDPEPVRRLLSWARALAHDD